MNNQQAGRIDPNLSGTFYGQIAGNATYTGGFNSGFGKAALRSLTSGSRNTSVGNSSSFNITDGHFNTSTGETALYGNTTGWSNTAVGYSALFTNTTGNNNTTIGANADVSSANLTNATAIGYNAKVGASNSLVLGGTGATAVKVGIGLTTPVATLDILGNIKIVDGTQANGKVLTSDGTGLASWQTPGSSTGWTLLGNSGTVDGTNFIGTTDNIPFNIRVFNTKAGRIDATALNTFFGYQSGESTISTTANNNTAFGAKSLRNSTAAGINNSAVGFAALEKNTVGVENTSVGYNALNNNTSSSLNTAIGKGALFTQAFSNGGAAFNGKNTAIGYHALYTTNGTTTSEGIDNTSVGYYSGEANTTGIRNIYIGNLAGVTATSANANTTGNNNTYVGYGAGPASTTQLTNAAAFGYRALVNASNSLVLGGTGADAVSVGIGTTTPGARLDVQSGDINTSGEINRTSTGASNMVPIAYGAVDQNGSILTGSGNFSIVNGGGCGGGGGGTCHDITITGESYTDIGYITMATITQTGVGGQTQVIFTRASSGKLRITVTDTSGGTPGGVWSGYHFVVYKP